MAETLMKYIKYVSDGYGFAGQMKLAQMTLISSLKAATAPDSPENIAIFRKAVEQITGKPAPSL
jgi:hypothetical protein